ncbi:hypothetical protein M9H77_14106 [Catharanthus roseus]|uniref:Uncharacterized protein n=1 Tax=Catharanthus roseus TaxID=4058 RepID=A0ACC0BMA3_CATRO|nr:hypothetical protein M9H77_14106 [Catharanthus roseus]
MRVIRPRSGIIRIPLHIKPSPNEIRGIGLRTGRTGSQEAYGWFYLIHKDNCKIAKGLDCEILLELILRGAPQPSEGGEEGGEKFYEVRRKAEEESAGSGTAMPDDLQLMAIVAGRVSRGLLYGAGSEAAHFIAESSRAKVGLASVSAAFGEHMRRLFEHNQLAYIPFPYMMPLVRVAMSANTSTSTSTAAAAMGTSEFRPVFK